jgi:predicted DNA-binding transcriptional regulator AlpA
VTAKTDLPPVPPALADVALIDGPTCAAAGGISISTWHELVRVKDAPQPVMRAVRCTRWRLADVRAWLIARAAQATADDEVIRRATKASAKAKALRATAQAGA